MYSLQRKFPKDKIPYITGGGLNGTYEFAQFHLHWGGEDSTKGSEHQIRSKRHCYLRGFHVSNTKIIS